MSYALITGRGTSGSWRIRGQQLGAAIGAKVEPRANDFNGERVVVVVKRVEDAMLKAIRAARKPWVWDVVDSYPKPAVNRWTRDESLEWLKAELERLQPTAIIFPTRAMLSDAWDAGWSGRSIVLPHHSWPKYLRPNPVRERVQIVGYEGGADYLGEWQTIVDQECRKRGWRFVVNGDMRQADIGVALRKDCGYPALHWKSNCKLANLQALGLPAVCSPERGYIEFGSGSELYATSRPDLIKAFDMLAYVDVRRHISAQMVKAAPRINEVAREYAQWLARLSS